MNKLLCAYITMIGVALISPQVLAATAPRPQWASIDGVVDFKPLGNKPAQVEDLLIQMAVENAFARWGTGFDEGRMDVLRSLFTKDADYTVVLGSKQPQSHQVGVDAIIDRAQRVLKQHADQRRHAISNVIVDRVSNNEVTAVAYGIVTRAADGLSVTATVIYSAKLRREADGVWRFSKLIIGLDGDTQEPVKDSK